jgi:hypothetical protein
VSCICPPGTKSSFSQSVDNLFGDIRIPLPQVLDTEYLRGVRLYVTCPDYYGVRFSVGEPVLPTRIYDAGFISFIMGEMGSLPEFEIQWRDSFFFVPEGATEARVWLNVGCFAAIDFDVWTCPVEEDIPPPIEEGGGGAGSG